MYPKHFKLQQNREAYAVFQVQGSAWSVRFDGWGFGPGGKAREQGVRSFDCMQCQHLQAEYNVQYVSHDALNMHCIDASC